MHSVPKVLTKFVIHFRPFWNQFPEIKETPCLNKQMSCLSLSQVIGLHKNGYGRILAECMFTSKILYCYWACLAEDDDNFVVATNKALPSEDAKAFIRKNILGKSNEEIAEVES